ncbi:histidine kinase osmosensor [Sorochytrium milnesiophthora]
MQRTIDAMPDPVFLLDCQHRILLSNAAATSTFGAHATLATHRQSRLVSVLRVLPALRPLLAQDRPANTTWSEHVQIKPADKPRLYALARFVPWPSASHSHQQQNEDAANDCVRMLVLTDRSEAVQLARALRTTRQALADEVKDGKARLMLWICHQLRNPLHVIDNTAQMLLDDDADTMSTSTHDTHASLIKPDLHVISGATRQIRSLIDDTLELLDVGVNSSQSPPNTAKHQPQDPLEPLDLAQCVAKVCNDIQAGLPDTSRVRLAITQRITGSQPEDASASATAAMYRQQLMLSSSKMVELMASKLTEHAIEMAVPSSSIAVDIAVSSTDNPATDKSANITTPQPLQLTIQCNVCEPAEENLVTKESLRDPFVCYNPTNPSCMVSGNPLGFKVLAKLVSRLGGSFESTCIRDRDNGRLTGYRASVTLNVSGSIVSVWSSCHAMRSTARCHDAGLPLTTLHYHNPSDVEQLLGQQQRTLSDSAASITDPLQWSNNPLSVSSDDERTEWPVRKHHKSDGDIQLSPLSLLFGGRSPTARSHMVAPFGRPNRHRTASSCLPSLRRISEHSASPPYHLLAPPPSPDRQPSVPLVAAVAPAPPPSQSSPAPASPPVHAVPYNTPIKKNHAHTGHRLRTMSGHVNLQTLHSLSPPKNRAATYPIGHHLASQQGRRFRGITHNPNRPSPFSSSSSTTAATTPAQATAAPVNAAAIPSPHSACIHILLVEDNSLVARVTSAVLRKHGHTVTIAGNGRIALDLIEAADPHTHLPQHHFDLVLCDLMMPVMGGIDCCKHIRRHLLTHPHPRPYLPVVALTANALAEERDRCLENGLFDDFVTKPASADVLLAIIRKWMRFVRSNAPPVSPSVAA